MRVRGLRLNPSGLLLAGCTCAALNVLLIAVLEHGGMHYLAAAGLAFPPVLAVGYLLHARFTFHQGPRWRSFLPYAGAMALNLPASFLLLVMFCETLSLSGSAAMVLTTVALTGWNLLSPYLAFAMGRKVETPQGEPVRARP